MDAAFAKRKLDQNNQLHPSKRTKGDSSFVDDFAEFQSFAEDQILPFLASPVANENWLPSFPNDDPFTLSSHPALHTETFYPGFEPEVKASSPIFATSVCFLEPPQLPTRPFTTPSASSLKLPSASSSAPPQKPSPPPAPTTSTRPRAATKTSTAATSTPVVSPLDDSSASDEERQKKLKRERNRSAVQNYRKRRKEHVESLETKVGELTNTVDIQSASLQSLAEENNVLRQQLARLQEWISSSFGAVSPEGAAQHATPIKAGLLMFVVCLLVVTPTQLGWFAHDSTPSVVMGGRSLLHAPLSPDANCLHFTTNSTALTSDSSPPPANLTDSVVLDLPILDSASPVDSLSAQPDLPDQSGLSGQPDSSDLSSADQTVAQELSAASEIPESSSGPEVSTPGGNSEPQSETAPLESVSQPDVRQAEVEAK